MQIMRRLAFGLVLALFLSSACAITIARMHHPTRDADWDRDLDDCGHRADDGHARDHDGYVRDCLHTRGWR
jgi:hypothetical protein